MKKSTKIAIAILAIIAVIAIVIAVVFATKETGKDVTPTATVAPTATIVPTATPAPTATIAPTATLAPTNTVAPTATTIPTVAPTVAPTATATPTAEPTATSTPAPTATATPVPTEVPATVAPTATIAPTATSTPVPTATATPEPTPSPLPTSTPTPAPTSTPTPTPVVEEGTEAEYTFQMGDTVWYKYYDNSDLLVVTGQGATWDFEDAPALGEVLSRNERFSVPKTIVIEEGITRIGDYALSCMFDVETVEIPDSLKEVGDHGFWYAGACADSTTWINLDLSKIKTEPQSFYKANGLDNISGSSAAMCTPTPTPTATPTPTPNPEKPREIGATVKESYSTTTAEYWDNGSIYVKGSGDVNCGSYKGESLKEYNGKNVFDKVYFEEGITHVSSKEMNDILAGIQSENGVEYWLPKTMDITTLTKWGNTGFDIDFTIMLVGDVVHGYYNGEPVTLKFIANEEAIALAEEHNVTYNPTAARYSMKEVNEILEDVAKTGTFTYTPEVEVSQKYEKCYAELSILIEWK